MDLLQGQLNALRSEVYDLRTQELSQQSEAKDMYATFSKKEPQPTYLEFQTSETNTQDQIIQPISSDAENNSQEISDDAVFTHEYTPKQTPHFNLEEYIGGNLLSKLGMLILLIGLGIFVKYAIDHDMISPLGRMLLSYTAGLVLIGLSYRLKTKYQAYSAVLMGGGIAALYFTTFIGYTYYDLMPQVPAFLLMFLCTVFAVYQAIIYDEEIIGLIGLVGAYAVPLLLGREGGEVAVMFAYMTLVNFGILSVAFWKDWNRANLAAFVITWLVFLSWKSLSYDTSKINTALIFNLIFFLTFYATLIVYQVRRQKEFAEIKIILLFVNALFFYIIGFSLFPYGKYWDLNTQYTFFDLFNCALHAGVSIYLYRVLPPGDQMVKNLCSGLAVAFLTLAIPTFFYKNTELVTIFWFVEVGFLFAFARNQKLIYLEYFSYLIAIISTISVIPTMKAEWMTIVWLIEMSVIFVVGSLLESVFFRRLSYVVAALGALSIPIHFDSYWAIYLWFGQAILLLNLARWQKSDYLENIAYGVTALMVYGLLHVWQYNYFISDNSPRINFLWNITQLHTWLVVLGLALIAFLVKNIPATEPDVLDPLYFLKKNPYIVFSGLILGIVYVSIFWEIYYYFEYQEARQLGILHQPRQVFCLLIYSGIYLSGLLFLSKMELYTPYASYLKVGLTILCGFYLLALTINTLESELILLNHSLVLHPYLNLRWGLYAVVILLIISILINIKTHHFHEPSYFYALILGLNFTILFGLSLELYVQFVLQAGESLEYRAIAANHALKAGFDLLWSLYSLGLIGYGIYQKRKYLRLAGIFLFGITLAKLFLADINYNSTLNMILAFVGMGILLLVTAFVYQRYKDLIFAKDETSDNEPFQ
ncbi:MAG: DUF2339 domain-containing protein [Microscillaceae bacterium]|nr:DUF2339 domain-containing protein [Microscillaceae bacterium]